MMLILLSAALLQVGSIADDAAARRAAITEGGPLFQQIRAAWHDCSSKWAGKLSVGKDAADVIAEAALAKCAQWEAPMREAAAQQVAAHMVEMPYGAALRRTEAHSAELLDQARDIEKRHLVAEIVEQRAR